MIGGSSGFLLETVLVDVDLELIRAVFLASYVAGIAGADVVVRKHTMYADHGGIASCHMIYHAEILSDVRMHEPGTHQSQGTCTHEGSVTGTELLGGILLFGAHEFRESGLSAGPAQQGLRGVTEVAAVSEQRGHGLLPLGHLGQEIFRALGRAPLRILRDLLDQGHVFGQEAVIAGF